MGAQELAEQQDPVQRPGVTWPEKGHGSRESLGDKLHSATSLLDLALGKLGDEFGLDKQGLLWQLALAEHLEDAVLRDVNDWGAASVLCSLQPGLQAAADHDMPAQ